jgi:hypothetical protein
MMDERRFNKRRKFGYYMRVVDNNTHALIGYLSDISSRGFKLDSKHALVVDRDYALRLDLTSDISEKPFIVFVARTKWSQPDSTDPFGHNVGFQIISIAPQDEKIFQRIVEKYGTPESTW